MKFRKILSWLLLGSVFALCLTVVAFIRNNDGTGASKQIHAEANGENGSQSASSDSAVSVSGAIKGTGSLLESDLSNEPENTGEEYSFDETVYPYYGMLSEDQKAVYCQIYANALEQNDTFTLTKSLTESSLLDTVCAVYNDHPELFWLETAYSYYYNDSGRVVAMKLYYYMTGSTLAQAKENFEFIAQRLISAASSYSTQMEQELYVHDAINDMAVYNASADMNQSAYSALVNGSTVCAGYARAFQYVMQQLGYSCYYCTGTSDGQDHAWNIVEIEGEFYNVDLTWDDSISEAYGAKVYTYFNLTDKAISVDHTRSTLSCGLPSCTSTAMAYTSVYGDTVSIDDIDVGTGTHADGDMVITPSKPEITDWRNMPETETEIPETTAESVEALPENQEPQTESAQLPSESGESLPDSPEPSGNPEVPQGDMDFSPDNAELPPDMR